MEVLVDSSNLTPARRTTRSALAEIPTRLGSMSIDEMSEAMTMGSTQTPTLSGRDNLWNMSINLPSSMISPSPSPDELIIQQRGRRHMPTTWSPDIDSKKPPGSNRTPVKKDSPSKTGTSTIVLRSTPRKRLLMELIPSPRKASSPKKARLDVKDSYTGPLKLALKGLSHDQLVDVIEKIAELNSDMEQTIKDLLPAPDIRPLEDQLSYLKKNIYKSLPSNRLTSKTDSPAYSRAQTHLLAFKKCVLEQGRQLVDSQQWSSVLEYTLLAWTYVRATPLWDNPPHNAPRRQCFKSLAAQIMMAIKRGNYTEEEYDQMEIKLQDCIVDCEDIQSCIKHLSAIRGAKH